MCGKVCEEAFRWTRTYVKKYEECPPELIREFCRPCSELVMSVIHEEAARNAVEAYKRERRKNEVLV
jgi:hypothetical protein